MDSASTAKQRHVESCLYRPIYDWKRDSRVIANNGANQTFKHKGDLIIDARGRKTEVDSNGWR